MISGYTCARVDQLPILGIFTHPTENDGNPYNGYLNPLRIGIDDHPLYYMEIIGVLIDPNSSCLSLKWLNTSSKPGSSEVKHLSF